MRKRAQRRYMPTEKETVITTKRYEPPVEKKPFRIGKNSWVAIALIAIFFLVLLFNTYFNLTSDIAYNPEGERLEKYYLSGPDPYYNMRLVEETHKTGIYPYYQEQDPLLNYPEGASGGRPPLLNMMAIGFSRFLTPFMGEADAIGRSMQFIPALFGALLIFPVYFIGKTLFNKKAGLIAAFFIAVIPIHIGSGHGSAYSLFDHDSFNLLLFFMAFLFLILSIREKNYVKSLLYAILGGVSLAALTMVWVESQFLYVVIALYAIVQILIDVFYNKFEKKVFTTTTLMLFSGYLISLPVTISRPSGFSLNIQLFLAIVVLIFGVFNYILSKRKIPWLLSLPSILIIGGIGLIFVYFIEEVITVFNFLRPIQKLSSVLFGKGIYGNKVSMTIAEANTFEISHTVMSFGPVLYWLGWAGFVLLLLYFYKEKIRRDYFFIIILFIVDLWLATTAGRFLNDMVPLIAILGGWITWFVISKIDYKQMIRSIRGAGGGFHGIRRGVKLIHVAGILFFAFLVIFPNVFVTLDAAVPNRVYEKEDGNWSNIRWEVFGEGYTGAYGLQLNKEVYWSDAFNWLNKQDTDIAEPTERPGFISWWDYGFYEVALGGHPTVADNFQDGIPPASNFHTAISEKDAVTVWIVRLLQGDLDKNGGKISDSVKQVLDNHLLVNISEKIVKWLESPKTSPSYGAWINEEYNEYINEKINEVMLTIGAQWPDNAVYQDVVALFNDDINGLTEEQVTMLYHDLQEATGLSIRYYGVEGYDREIFNIFAFLSDKSLIIPGAPEDDFITVTYSGYEVNPFDTDEKTRDIENEPLIDYLEKSDDEKRVTAVTGFGQIYKDDYFDTMFYKTYVGPYTETQGQKTVWDGVQQPCINMKHFYAEYVSNISNPLLQYKFSGKAAVIIAKYYEGAFINGSVLYKGKALNNTEIVIQKNVTYSPGYTFPVDHDKYNIYSDENPDGNFSVLAGAGGRLLVRRYPELVSPKFLTYGFPLKIISFNSTTNPNEYSISDDDAMRKSDNYERYLNISIEPGKIEGYVYDNKDNNETYNASIDSPIKNADIYLYEIYEFDRDAFIQSTSGTLQVKDFSQFPTASLKSNDEGYYNSSDLTPGYYIIEVFVDGYKYDSNLIDIGAGNTTYNISKPKLSGLNGSVYFDEDGNGEYDEGEEVTNIELDLTYGGETKDTITTDSNGFYSFKDLIPGTVGGIQLNNYVIKVATSTYQKEIDVFPDENKTTIFNISLDLTPVEVTGIATYNGLPVDDVTIDFNIDESEDINTAIENSAKTDASGAYTLDVTPGRYNVTAIKYEGETLVYESDIKKIELARGDDSETINFVITKKSVTVTGIASYEGKGIDNITLTFSLDNEIENNTAIYATAASNKNGIYAVELSPGTYYVDAESIEPVEINGVNYTYINTNQTDNIAVTEDEIDTGVIFNIILETREAD